MIDRAGVRLRVAVVGSMAFLLHLTALLLFGPFWAALVAAGSSCLGDAASRRPALKAAFNAVQKAGSVALAGLVYKFLGAHSPPSFLAPGADWLSIGVQREFGLFFVAAAVYFLSNSIMVSAVVAADSGRTTREVWAVTRRGVLGYDLFGGVIPPLAALMYSRLDAWGHLGPVGLLAMILPLLVIRHVYFMYRQIQDSGQELLELMVKAIEARDPYTSGHSLRVAALSRAIAVELGLSAKQIEQIQTAALLHDVGKIH